MATTWTKRGERSVSAAQSTTETAPTLATEGVFLTDVLSIMPVLHAPSGQTFTGTGTMLGYLYNPVTSAWVRAPRADLDMADAAGLQDAVLAPLPVTTPAGRFAWVPSSVALSSGTTMTTDYVCVMRRDGKPG